MTTTRAERDLFEAHMLKVTGKRPMTWGETPGRPAEVADSIDRYREPGHQFAWELWQSARAALASSPARSVTAEEHHVLMAAARDSMKVVGRGRLIDSAPAVPSPAPSLTDDQICKLAEKHLTAFCDSGHAWFENEVEFARAVLALAAPVAQPEPSTKLVPIEPTLKMSKAAADAWLDSKGALMLNRAAAVLRAGIAAAPSQPEPTAGSQPDMRAICEALGFDPTNHHNAAKCPYCRPSAAAPDEGEADPLAEAILKGLTYSELRAKALYLMELNANQARTIDALLAATPAPNQGEAT